MTKNVASLKNLALELRRPVLIHENQFEMKSLLLQKNSDYPCDAVE